LVWWTLETTEQTNHFESNESTANGGIQSIESVDFRSRLGWLYWV
jgi:hypothetical protein